MMNTTIKRMTLFYTLGLAACTTVPPAGPAVMVLPGTSSTFDQFRVDDGTCKRYALDSLGQTTAAQAAADSAVNSAVTGAAVGAAAGALIGAVSGDPAGGAALGAGTGLLVGSAGGVGAYHEAAYETQQRYDTAYIQCMYAQGHQVPVPANQQSAAAGQLSAAPAPQPPGPVHALPPPPPR